MTIEPRWERVLDLHASEEWCHFARDQSLAGVALGAVVAAFEGLNAKSAHARAIPALVEAIGEQRKDHVPWLLACHTAWQDKTAVVRHRRLWGDLASRGLTLPSGRRIAERAHESPLGLRYFGLMELTNPTLDDAIAVLEVEKASHIVMLAQAHERRLIELLDSGWSSKRHRPSPELLLAACSAQGFVISPFGFFDDFEAGALAIGPAALIGQLGGCQ